MKHNGLIYLIVTLIIVLACACESSDADHDSVTGGASGATTATDQAAATTSYAPDGGIGSTATAIYAPDGIGSLPTVGAINMDDIIEMLAPVCDPNAQSVSSCGGIQCPSLPDWASSTCTATCCTADAKCGTRNTDTRYQALLGNSCVAPAEEDPRCPSTNIAGLILPGCCDAMGLCGQLFATICINTTLEVRACDASPSVDGDDEG